MIKRPGPMGRLCGCCTGQGVDIPLLVGMGLVVGQQVTGLPAMLYYCVDIFKEVAHRWGSQ